VHQSHQRVYSQRSFQRSQRSLERAHPRAVKAIVMATGATPLLGARNKYEKH